MSAPTVASSTAAIIPASLKRARIEEPLPAASPLQAALGVLTSPWRHRSTPPAAAATAATPASAGAVVSPRRVPAPLPVQSAVESFDALAYHRAWCPCVYAEKQEGQQPGAAAAVGGASAGWLWLMEQLGSGGAGPAGGGKQRQQRTAAKEGTAAAAYELLGGGGKGGRQAGNDDGGSDDAHMQGVVKGIWDALRS